MKNKYLYLTIGIIIILVISIAAYIDLSNTVNPASKPVVTPTPSAVSTPAPTLSATSTPAATAASTATTTPTSSPTSTVSSNIPLTFTASGLDNSANSTVIMTSEGNVSYSNMPFTLDVASGTFVSFVFQSNVSTVVPNCLFTLSSAPSTNSITVTASTTINATYGRAIIDYSGTFVQLPAASQINRIADSWAAHNTILVMCGAGSKIVATTPVDTTITLFNIILPPMATMSDPFDTSGNPNIEQLLADNPNIVFMSWSASSTPAYQTMVNAGLCVVRMYFANFPDMLNTVQQTGWILGPSALTKANAYISYFNGVYNNITAVTSQIPNSQKPTILHIVGNNNPLVVDGNNTLIDTWINICGGVNAAEPVSGNGVTVTLEQVLAWNPQVILIGSATATSTQSTILSNPQWSQVSAVVNGKVIVNPMGVFDWSRYSVEEALNIQWVAKTLYPSQFSNIDMAAQTKYFYQTFYGYTLSDDQVNAILNNTTPPST